MRAQSMKYRKTWGDDAPLALHRHRPLLSRLHRKVEVLDSACLRALGHPHDHAVRQELLSALEWDASYNPEHARPQIRSLFKEVHDRSVKLSLHIQSGANHLASDSIAALRKSLGSLTHMLSTRHDEPSKS
jgi:hypothetical protein